MNPSTSVKLFKWLCSQENENCIFSLFKNGNQHNFTKYRPISLLPQFSKILEKVFSTRLEKFVEKYHLINERYSCYNNLPVGIYSVNFRDAVFVFFSFYLFIYINNFVIVRNDNVNN